MLFVGYYKLNKAYGDGYALVRKSLKYRLRHTVSSTSIHSVFYSSNSGTVVEAFSTSPFEQPVSPREESASAGRRRKEFYTVVIL